MYLKSNETTYILIGVKYYFLKSQSTSIKYHFKEDGIRLELFKLVLLANVRSLHFFM